MPEILDLIIVGAGPTGIAVGAEAKSAGLNPLLIDQGSLVEAIRGFPTHMEFFTTRDKLEIAGVPLAIPNTKPTRQQALVYYRLVAEQYQLEIAPWETVEGIRQENGAFRIFSRGRQGATSRYAHSVVLATGYFDGPKHLEVPGEDQAWVRYRYLEPYEHVGEHVVVVGGGNSACETALDLWRNGAEVTLVHRGLSIKPSVKYWLKPDVENRLAEGEIEAIFESEVVEFGDRQLKVRGATGEQVLEADAAYIHIGYLPDVDFQRRCGIDVDPESLIPTHDPETGETNVSGLFVAGTLRVGRATNKIFIENSRDHGEGIVRKAAARVPGGSA